MSALSAAADAERPVLLLRYLDVALLVLGAPIMLLIGVPAVGYGVGAGTWLGLRLAGLGVERLAGTRTGGGAIGLRLGFLLGRLFLLAIAVILVRKGAGRDAGLAALLVIVAAYTVFMATSVADRPRRS